MNIEQLKKNKLKIIVFLLIFFLVILPSIYIAISFIGKISASTVIPGYFTAYAYIPNTIHTANKLLAHEPFSDILDSESFSKYLPVVFGIKQSGILEKKRMRLAGKAPLDWALFPDGKFLATWDMGISAPFFRFFLDIPGDDSIPNLYYVKAGRKSRYEYITGESTTYIQRYKNLLIISNDLELFESILDGTYRNITPGVKSSKKFLSADFDIGFIVVTDDVKSRLAASSPMIMAFSEKLQFSDFSEITLSFSSNQINASITSSVVSENEAINKLLSRDSKAPGLVQYLPAIQQYSVVYSIGSIEEMLNASLTVFSQGAPVNLRQIDRSARIFLGIGLSDLLFSWTGTEIAALRIEGTAQPVFVLQISDKQKQQEVFEKAFSPRAADNNETTRITLPRVLNIILNMWGINFLEPYYIIQDDFLFLSESPESLKAAVSPIRNNNALTETDAWESLSQASSDKSSLTLFYSLDDSFPSFLSGDENFGDVLKLYRQGLIRANIDNGMLAVSLSAAP